MEPEAIVAAARDGDTTARAQLADLLNTELARYFARAAGGTSIDLEDLQQKTFMAVWEHLHVFEDRGPRSFVRWTHGIARRRMLKEWRAQRRETTALAAFAQHPHASTLSLDSRVTLQELEQQIGAGFGELTGVQQLALIWEFEERDDAELAAHLGMSVGALRKQRARARAALAKRTQKVRRTPLPRLPRAQPDSPRVQPDSTPKKL